MTWIMIVLLLLIIWLLLRQQGVVHMQLTLPKSKHRLLLDSCSLIDGRITAVIKAGFLGDELVIPQFILSELQLLADGQDAHKRERARYGLDVAKQLQTDSSAHVSIDHSMFQTISTNDDKLVALAKKLHARLYTTDYNLQKVASLEGIEVININELAQVLRPVNLPGEEISVEVIQKGSNPDQGVGYLEDGTMIVIDNAAGDIGKRLDVLVDKIHQTVSGKMVFAHSKHGVVRVAKPRKTQTTAQVSSVQSRLRQAQRARSKKLA